jgi:hypothetical protein
LKKKINTSNLQWTFGANLDARSFLNEFFIKSQNNKKKVDNKNGQQKL